MFKNGNKKPEKRTSVLFGENNKNINEKPRNKNLYKKITENAELQKVANYLATSQLRVKP